MLDSTITLNGFPHCYRLHPVVMRVIFLTGKERDLTMTEERDFKGVWIPREIWLDDRLNALDKVILTEIDSLDSSEKGCWASNKYIAEFCQCSESKVSQTITKLTKLGYLRVVSFDGRQREIKSNIAMGIKNYEADSQKIKDSLLKFNRQNNKNYEADSQKIKESNIDSNIDNNKEINIINPSTTCKDYNNNNNSARAEHPSQKATKEKKPTPERLIIPPTLKMVETYCKERNNGIDPEAFIDYYAARGWYLNKKQRMVDWHAAVGTWERNAKERQASKQNNTASFKGEQLVTINGAQYIQRGMKYYLPNGSGVAVDPYAPDDLPY